MSVPGRVLDNGLIRVEVAEDGTLSSVYDLRADREVLAGQGNLLRLHTDLPNYWDAWDVDKHYKNRYTDLLAADAVTVVEQGPPAGAKYHGVGRFRPAAHPRVGRPPPPSQRRPTRCPRTPPWWCVPRGSPVAFHS